MSTRCNESADKSYFHDSSYCHESIGEPYILEAYIPKEYATSTSNGHLQLAGRNELRHAVGGVAAHTLRYFSRNNEGFNVFRARGEAVWWLRHIYNSFKWWRAYCVNAEGERKNMPMLYVGETFGIAASYDGREADIVLSAFENDNGIIDPEDSIGTIFAAGYSERGGLFNSPDKYAVKTIIGKKYAGSGVNVMFPVRKNLRLMAEQRLRNDGRDVNAASVQEELCKIRVVVLDRERHEGLIETIKKMGSQLILVDEDDLSPTFAVMRGEVDFITGVGGTPEGVLSAMLVEKLGGEMTFRLLPNDVVNDADALAKQENWNYYKMDEVEILRQFKLVTPGTEKAGELPYNKVFTSRELAGGCDMVFTASVIKKTPWIKDRYGNDVPGVEINPDSGELVVHIIRVVGSNVEIAPVIYKTAINKCKKELRLTDSVDDHAHIHIQLAKVYAEFGLFEMAGRSIGKAMRDLGVTDKHRVKYERVVAYIRGLEFLTNDNIKTLEHAVDYFEDVIRLDPDNEEGLNPKRMIKRIYEYMGDISFHADDNRDAIRNYRKALKYGLHELKLHRKINTADMRPILSKYFESVNRVYDRCQFHTADEWDRIKLSIALKIFQKDYGGYPFIAREPWSIYFRRTVLHNVSLSYKLALLVKVRLLLHKLNCADDGELAEFLSDKFCIAQAEIDSIVEFRRGMRRGGFQSVSELYFVKGLKIDCLVKLLVPNVKVYAHNELETADIPISISRCEAVERRSKNILQEIKENYKEDAQEHSYAVGEAYHYMGLALHDVGDLSGARINYGKAIRKFREIIEKFEGITPVNAQFRIGNMFEEMALLFTEKRGHYTVKAMNEYNKLVDEMKAVQLFGNAYKLNAVRIEQAEDKVNEMKSIVSHPEGIVNSAHCHI